MWRCKTCLGTDVMAQMLVYVNDPAQTDFVNAVIDAEKGYCNVCEETRALEEVEVWDLVMWDSYGGVISEVTLTVKDEDEAKLQTHKRIIEQDKYSYVQTYLLQLRGTEGQREER